MADYLDDSIYIVLRLRDMTKEAADAALLNLKRKVAEAQTLATSSQKSSSDAQQQVAEQKAIALSAEKRGEIELAVMKQRRQLLTAISQAETAGLDVSQAKSVVAQELALQAGIAENAARAEARALGTVLARETEILRTRTARVAAGLRDPFGKHSGGARGRVQLNSLGDVLDLFTSREGLQARTVSLLGGQIGTILAYTAVLGGAIGLTRTMISAQGELEQENKRLGIVFDETGDSLTRSLQAAEEQVRSFGRSHGQEFGEMTKAQYELAAAGFNTLETLKAFPATALLAQGGLIGLPLSAETVSTSLQTFGREGKLPIEVANEMQTVAAETQAQIDGLAVSLSYSAGSAAAAGGEFSELVSILGALGTFGLIGSKAGTSLNQVYTQLLKKRSEIRELGIDIADAAGQLRPIVDILADFREQFGTRLSAGELEILKDLFDVRGARAFERLIPDLVVLPRVLRQVRDSETEIFRAAEVGSDTFRESFAVFKNQFTDFLLGNGAVTRGLKNLFDNVTTRQGLRGISNMQTGSAGLRFEIEKLRDRSLEGGDALRKWLIELRAASIETGEKLAPSLELAARRAFELENSLTFQVLGPAPYASKRINEIEQLVQVGLAEMDAQYQILKKQEDIYKGSQLFRQQFGIEPIVPLTKAQGLELGRSDFETQLQVLELNIAEGEKQLARLRKNVSGEGTLGQLLGLPASIEIERTTEAVSTLSQVLKFLKQDTDKSVEVESTRRAVELGKLQLEAKQVELDLLSARGTTDPQARLRELDLSAQIAAEAAKIDFETRKKAIEAQKDLQTKNAEDIAKELLVLEGIYQNKLDAIAVRREEGRKQIRLQILRQEFGQRDKIASLETQLRSLTVDAGLLPQLELDEELAKMTRKVELLDAQLAEGVITSSKYIDTLIRLDLELSVFKARQAQAARQREADLFTLGQAEVLEQSQRLILLSRGRDEFRAREHALDLQENAERGRLEKLHVQDDARLKAELLASEERFATERLRLRIDEAQFIQQVELDSLDAISAGFRGLYSLVEVTSGQARAKVLGDAATVADTASSLIGQFDKISRGLVSPLAGGLGIIGTLASGITSLFSDRERDAEVVRELSREFRHQEGRTASASFGQPTTNIVQVSISANFEHLVPDQRQSQLIVNRLGPMIEDYLEERGIGGG